MVAGKELATEFDFSRQQPKQEFIPVYDKIESELPPYQGQSMHASKFSTVAFIILFHVRTDLRRMAVPYICGGSTRRFFFCRYFQCRGTI
jgi:hypothetical protein